MRKWIATVAVLLVAALAAGLWAFEPWTKFTSSTVDEALPGVSATAEAPPSDSPTTSEPVAATGEKKAEKAAKKAEKKKQATPTPEPVPEVVTLASGEFEDAEYATSGTAKVIRLADGTRFVRLEGFSTSDGPDVFVGLSASPSGGAWGSYDDLRYVQLGGLKATNGNQNYEIPPDVDLDGFRSVVIWCDRFDVAFGTAPVSL